MIIQHIIGGLGNQMFQFSAGRALSLTKGVPLKLEIKDLIDYSLHHGFELDRIFNMEVNYATDKDLQLIIGWRRQESIRRLLQKRYLPKLGDWVRGKRFVVEPQTSWWPGLTAVPEECYLVGYWQSEKYFKHMSDVIRSDFSFSGSLGDCNAALAAKIDSCNAVSLHVRRGDYVANPLTLATHGLCSLDYYQRAVNHIAAHVEKPVFFIFSDDVHWARENLSLNFPCNYVSQNSGTESYNDMRLMTFCRHNIIANSSFSWWGAWLNSYKEKIVVAPMRWFAINCDSRDLVPEDWVKL